MSWNLPDEGAEAKDIDIDIDVGDDDPPKLEITSPTSDIVKEDTFYVNWEGHDEETKIKHYEVKLDNQNWVSTGENEQRKLKSLEEGEHTVYVKAIDMAKNETEKSISFIVDTKPPSIDVANPPEDDIVGTDEVTIRWVGSDEGSGISKYEVRFDNNPWIDVATTTHHTFSDLPRGEHSSTVRAIDNAEREGRDEVTFEVRRPASVPFFKRIINRVMFFTVRGKRTGVRGEEG